ncbi:MAG: hypothetical protein ACR2P4_08535, partial [Gammaproteobacteria bacterium]
MMNNELPIVVKPSRFVWGVWALIWAGVLVTLVNSSLDTAPTGREKWLIYAIAAFFGGMALKAGWHWIFLPPRIIIDEDGVGGRFVGGGFVGTTRIAWDDIIGAQFIKQYGVMDKHSSKQLIVLDVNNTGGRYRPARKLLRLFSAMLKKYLPGKETPAFAFDVTNSELNDRQAKEIVAVINNRAKAAFDVSQESGKSPFTADAADDTLPIVVSPSRWIWGVWVVSWTSVFAVPVYGLVAWDGAGWGTYAAVAVFGFALLRAMWNCFFIPPRMIIDESGVGGRFVGGGFVGTARVAWGDITGARYMNKYSHLARETLFFVILDVDNFDGKYLVRKFARWWSPIAWWEKSFLRKEDSAFAFNVTNAKLNNEQARKVVAVINNRANNKP